MDYQKKKYLSEMGLNLFWLKSNHKLSEEHQSKLGSNLDELKLTVSSCKRCDLSQTRDKTVFGSGQDDSKIMIIGEAPGKDEDLLGEPFVGRAGKLLDEILLSIGIERQSVYVTNTIKCRPPDNRNPKNDEIESCADYLDEQIDTVNPSVIVLLGKVAANRLLQMDETMQNLRNQVFLHKKSNTPMIVFYHPAYILRSPLQKRGVWQDLKFLMSTMEKYGSTSN